MRDVLNEFKRDVVRLFDAEPAQRPVLEEQLSQEFQALDALGYYLFGIRRVIPKIDGGRHSLAVLTTFYMSHSRSPRVVRDKDLMVVPAVLTELMK